MPPDPFDVEAASRLRSYERRIDRLETLESGVGGGDFVLIEHLTTVAAQSSVNFTNIPAVHTHLFIIYSIAGTATNPELTLNIQINGDGSNNYSFLKRLMFDDDTQSTSDNTNAIVIAAGQEGNSDQLHAPGWILIPDYLGTNNEKALRGGGFAELQGPALHQNITGGMWKTIDEPIDRLQFFLGGSLFRANSTISLYGIN